MENQNSIIYQSNETDQMNFILVRYSTDVSSIYITDNFEFSIKFKKIISIKKLLGECYDPMPTEVELLKTFKYLLEERLRSEKIATGLSRKKMEKYLEDPELRMSLFTEICDISEVKTLNENLTKIVIKNSGTSNGFQRFFMNLKYVYSYREDGVIVDLCPVTGIFYIFKIEENSLEILHDKKGKLMNAFMESLRIKKTQEEILDMMEYIQPIQVMENKISELVVDARLVYFELNCSGDETVMFQIKSIIRSKVYIRIEVNRKKPFRILFPLEKNDCVKLSLSSCQKTIMGYKIISIPGSVKKIDIVKDKTGTGCRNGCLEVYKNIDFGRNNFFIDGIVLLEPRKQLSIPLEGVLNTIIYWKKNWDGLIGCYIEDNVSKQGIDGSGVFLTDERKYKVIYINRGKKKTAFRIFLGLCRNDPLSLVYCEK